MGFSPKKMSVKELKAVQLGILLDVVSYCENKGISYYLGAGTLLGAIRHNGYIPWDDDIDILMPRPDYERFVQSFNHNARPAEVLKVAAYETDPSYIYPFAKVCNLNTYLEEHAA